MESSSASEVYSCFDSVFDDAYQEPSVAELDLRPRIPKALDFQLAITQAVIFGHRLSVPATLLVDLVDFINKVCTDSGWQRFVLGYLDPVADLTGCGIDLSHGATAASERWGPFLDCCSGRLGTKPLGMTSDTGTGSRAALERVQNLDSEGAAFIWLNSYPHAKWLCDWCKGHNVHLRHQSRASFSGPMAEWAKVLLCDQETVDEVSIIDGRTELFQKLDDVVSHINDETTRQETLAKLRIASIWAKQEQTVDWCNADSVVSVLGADEGIECPTELSTSAEQFPFLAKALGHVPEQEWVSTDELNELLNDTNQKWFLDARTAWVNARKNGKGGDINKALETLCGNVAAILGQRNRFLTRVAPIVGKAAVRWLGPLAGIMVNPSVGLMVQCPGEILVAACEAKPGTTAWRRLHCDPRVVRELLKSHASHIARK